MEEYKKTIKQEIDDFSKDYRMSPAYRKKKLIIWCVRTALSAILYIIFWKYEWVRWTLILYIPLAIFNLVMIFRFNQMLDKRVYKLRSMINQ